MTTNSIFSDTSGLDLYSDFIFSLNNHQAILFLIFPGVAGLMTDDFQLTSPVKLGTTSSDAEFGSPNDGIGGTSSWEIIAWNCDSGFGIGLYNLMDMSDYSIASPIPLSLTEILNYIPGNDGEGPTPPSGREYTHIGNSMVEPVVWTHLLPTMMHQLV